MISRQSKEDYKFDIDFLNTKSLICRRGGGSYYLLIPKKLVDKLDLQENDQAEFVIHRVLRKDGRAIELIDLKIKI